MTDERPLSENRPLSIARDIPRIVVAGVASNVGKTTVTVGLIGALRARGLEVQPFKCGPDYIDPSYHERAAGRPCRNLDVWMLDDAQLLAGFARACADADIAVIEGVMGLFDGSNWHDERASTAQIAKLLGAPVLLVIDISGAARSAAAIALGCQHFDPQLPLCGVALNFAGSEGHAKGCAEAITRTTGLPALGWLPRNRDWQIPERHLGLVPSGEHVEAGVQTAGIVAAVEKYFDVAAVTDIARTAGALPSFIPCNAENQPSPRHGSSVRRPILAVARDEAFCFYYPENLELLADAGAEIEFFSPLRGESPSVRAAGVYLGGGYPELHGAALASNAGLWSALRYFRAQDAPIYAECGGFMVLTQALIDREGRHWPMAGLIPGVVRMTDSLAELGYRYATAPRANLLADRGSELRGHEFRYSRWVCDEAGVESAWQVRGTRMAAPADSGGFASSNLLASYLHIHFGQRADIASRIVEKLRPGEYRSGEPPSNVGRDVSRPAD
jgi:cobyrinic acid a,c-diamide synthase